MPGPGLRIEELLKQTEAFVKNVPEDLFNYKPSSSKWSKKEILGHLIDSAINNLQRFTEIQFSPKPFAVRRYNQNELVRVNDYQHAPIQDLLILWTSLNKQIIRVIEQQTETTLNYSLEMTGAPLFDLAGTPNKTTSDLRFLITDYVDHMEHHLRQLQAR